MVQSPASRIALGVLLAMAIACGDASGPDSVALTGTYEYRAELPFSISSATERIYHGTLVITYASKDSVDGDFDVRMDRPLFDEANQPGLIPDSFDFAYALQGRYVVRAREVGWPLEGVTLQTTLVPTNAGFRCDDVRRLGLTRQGELKAIVGTCSMRRLG